MEDLFSIWLMHAGVAAVLSAPIVFFGRRRVNWQMWALTDFVVPFIIWVCLMDSPLSVGKSLANLAEAFFVSLAVPVAALVRVAVGRAIDERICAGILLAALCCTAAMVFFIVPPLPE